MITMQDQKQSKIHCRPKTRHQLGLIAEFKGWTLTEAFKRAVDALAKQEGIDIDREKPQPQQ